MSLYKDFKGTSYEEQNYFIDKHETPFKKLIKNEEILIEILLGVPQYIFRWDKLQNTDISDALLVNILQHLNGYQLSKNRKLTPKFIEKFIGVDWDWKLLSNNQNIDETFVEKFIDKPWSFGLLAINKNISFDFIEKHRNKPWWNNMHNKEGLTIRFITKHIDINKDWNWWSLYSDSIITLEFIKENSQKIREISGEDYDKMLSYNPNITQEFIDENSHKIKWDFNGLSSNRHLKIEFIKKTYKENWNWAFLSLNPAIRFEHVFENPQFPWNCVSFLRNPNFTEEVIKNNIKFIKLFCSCEIEWELFCEDHRLTCYIIKNNIDIGWDFYALTKNPNICCNFISEYPEKDWYWKHINKKMKLNEKFLEDNEKNINYKLLSENPYLTEKIIEKNIDKNWDWKILTKSKCVSYDFIRLNCQLNWDWDEICRNPNLDFERIDRLLMLKGEKTIDLDNSLIKIKYMEFLFSVKMDYYYKKYIQSKKTVIKDIPFVINDTLFI